MEKRICTTCGKEIGENASFCKYCGSRQELTKVRIAKEPHGDICPSCGAELASGAAFCKLCGASVSAFNNPAVKEEDLSMERLVEEGSSSRKKRNVPVKLIILLLSIGVLLSAAVVLWRTDTFGTIAETISSLLPGGDSQKNEENEDEEEEPIDKGDDDKKEASTENTVSIVSEEEEAKESEDTEAATSVVDVAALEVEPDETNISKESAQGVVESTYICSTEYVGEVDGVFVFDCFAATDATRKIGQVSVNAETGEIAVLSGMEPEADSAVKSVDSSKLSDLVENHAGSAIYSVAVLDLHTGEMVGTDNKAIGLSSSVLLDIPILYTIVRNVDAGTLSLSDKITFHYTTDGRGELSKADDGKQYTIQELITIMFRASDNNATNTLLDYLGYTNINKVCNDAGYPSVNLVTRIGSTIDNTSNDNYVSAADLCGMLYELYNDKYAIGKSFLQQYMRVVSDSNSNSGLGRDIRPSGYMNINGVKENKYNEVAIVESADACYAIAFLANGDKQETLANAAASVGMYVFETYANNSNV